MDNITDPERGTLGAVVKFVIERPQSYWLPEWDSVPYQLDYTSKSLGDEVSVVMPSDNFEAELNGNGEIVCEKRGRNLVFRMIDWPAYGSVKTRYTLRLRVGESYTRCRWRYCPEPRPASRPKRRPENLTLRASSVPRAALRPYAEGRETAAGKYTYR